MLTTKVMAITAQEPVFVLNGMNYYPHYSKPCWMQRRFNRFDAGILLPSGHRRPERAILDVEVRVAPG